MKMTIPELARAAQDRLDDIETELEGLRSARDDINDKIRVLVTEQQDARRAVRAFKRRNS